MNVQRTVFSVRSDHTHIGLLQEDPMLPIRPKSSPNTPITIQIIYIYIHTLKTLVIQKHHIITKWLIVPSHLDSAKHGLDYTWFL